MFLYLLSPVAAGPDVLVAAAGLAAVIATAWLEGVIAVLFFLLGGYAGL